MRGNRQGAGPQGGRRGRPRCSSLDEVSAALGHSSPVVTRRYYDHFVRKSFSPEIRRGLGIKEQKAEGDGRAKKGREEHPAPSKKKG